MVRDCVENQTPFGIVLVRKDAETLGHPEIFMVGCAVRVVGVHHINGGKMDIQVLGIRRFRVRKLDESDALLAGWVEPLDDDSDEQSEHLAALQQTLIARFRDFLAAYSGRVEESLEEHLPDEPEALSFALSALLPIELKDKQLLLECTNTIDRMEQLIGLYESVALNSEENPSNLFPHRLTSAEREPWISQN